MKLKKRILVAPLNWGLGHATRCIPIVNALLTHGFEPILASDGDALVLLKKEFPELTAVSLPSYNIKYAKKGKWFKLKFIQNSPKILKAIKAERKITGQLLVKYELSGIISDNRLGVYSKLVPCVFITHQLQVLSGNTTWLSTKLHQKYMRRFTECWVPDTSTEPNLSGKLGHVSSCNVPLKYIGPISRFRKTESEIVYDIMVLISGPEPQRELLERLLVSQLKNHPKKVLITRGVVEEQQTVAHQNNLTVYNFMTSEQLEQSLNRSALIISRSGYTTIMDLAKLEKKAFFIPTPGQFEQEYLAHLMQKQQLAPYCEQASFSLEKLDEVASYQGLHSISEEISFEKLFGLFQGK
ncbi:MAG TPA: glycosyltransferase [Flavobacteriaceae bacterium]|nr:glycosyltransferase [Flavobacteriaceae bacterium]